MLGKQTGTFGGLPTHEHEGPWPEPCESGCGMLILPPDPLRSGRWPCEAEPIGDLGYAVKGAHDPQRCQQLRRARD